ncbi:MAG TPA: glycoside hydrolase family 97 N-terminal domain-containing protein, partial [Paludibacter sp.]
MQKSFLIIAFICFSALLVQATNKKLTVTSPDGKLSIEASVTLSGAPIYTVKNNNQPIILQSALGLVSDQGDFSEKVKLSQVTPLKKITETYNAPAEKRTNRTYTANCASLTLT